jgi:hypothetical protein
MNHCDDAGTSASLPASSRDHRRRLFMLSLCAVAAAVSFMRISCELCEWMAHSASCVCVTVRIFASVSQTQQVHCPCPQACTLATVGAPAPPAEPTELYARSSQVTDRDESRISGIFEVLICHQNLPGCVHCRPRRAHA